jgi:hypothetical protein
VVGVVGVVGSGGSIGGTDGLNVQNWEISYILDYALDILVQVPTEMLELTVPSLQGA